MINLLFVPFSSAFFFLTVISKTLEVVMIKTVPNSGEINYLGRLEDVFHTYAADQQRM